MYSKATGQVSPAFWRGKKIFVTGHSGFKGSWLTLWLNALGAQVTGYSLQPNTKPSMYNILKMDDLCESHIADIRSINDLQKQLLESEPDIVIHLAAQPIVSRSFTDTRETWETNVLGTVNLLEVCRSFSTCLPVLIISSDKCYQNNELGQPFKTTDPLGGNDPYSASKAGTELVINSYRKSFFSVANAPVLASARVGNVIGGGDFADNRLLVDAVTAFQSGRRLTVRNPHAVRPWQHVLEPVYGYLLLIEKMCGNENLAQAWNFGPNPSANVDVGTIVKLVQTEWGDGAAYDTASDAAQWREAKLLSLDSSATEAALSWHCCLELPEAVDWTVRWYKTFYDHSPSYKSMRELSLEQIEAYYLKAAE